MEPFETIVYQDGRIEAGAFRCPARADGFSRAGAIRDHYVVAFPRTAVFIQHEGERPFVADAAVATVYNPGQPYSRAALDPRGDHCDWFALDATVAAAFLAEVDPRALEAPRWFRGTHRRVGAATYLRQRELIHDLAAGGADALEVEERVLDLLRALWSPSPEPSPRLTSRERRAVAQVRQVLAERFRDALSLPALAAEADLSTFRLCRAFRAQTGATLHAWREQLRLRAALGELEAGRDLTAVALESGYSSHSHFSERFRRAFGRTPSALRARLASVASP